jgi:hypothetical protein
MAGEEGNHGEKPRATGEQLAVSMLENLSLVNEAMRKSHVLQERLIELLDEQIEWWNVLDRTFELLHEQRGKKLSVADISQAWCEAAEEVFGEEEEEDEPDQGDPLVGSSRG